MVIVYLAGPLFSEAEQCFNRWLKELLVGCGCNVFLPQEDSDDSGNVREHLQQDVIFRKNLGGIRDCDVVVAVLDGVDVDSGTAWEVGYAYALGKKVLGFRTDFRTLGSEGIVNLMVEKSIIRLYTNVDELLEDVACLND